MATPVIGDLLKNTVGKVVEKIADKYFPPSMGEEERARFRLEAERLALDEYRAYAADMADARSLASKEADGAPPWTRVLTVTHRPVWSFLMLFIFGWTVLAPYMGFPQFTLTEVHKEIMQTVIIFYFGGRSVEKTAGILKGEPAA